jgi:hypothetical protein
MLPSRSASASFKLSKYRSIQWAKDMASALEQAVKPAPARGGGAEAAAIEDILCISSGFCSSALDGLSLANFLQVIKHQYISQYQDKEKGQPFTMA